MRLRQCHAADPSISGQEFKTGSDTRVPDKLDLLPTYFADLRDVQAFALEDDAVEGPALRADELVPGSCHD